MTIDTDMGLRLVQSVAKKVAASTGGVVRSRELLGPGWIGLLGAASRFREDRGAKFTTFAYRRVRGEMLDYLRSLPDRGCAPAPDSPAERVAPEPPDEDEVPAALLALHPRERAMAYEYFVDGKTYAEIAPAYGVSESRICQILRPIKQALKNTR